MKYILDNSYTKLKTNKISGNDINRRDSNDFFNTIAYSISHILKYTSLLIAV